MCYHVKFGRLASKAVRIIRRELRNWGTLGVRPLQWGRADPLEICFSPHVKFGRFASKSVLISRRELQNCATLGLRPLQWGRADPLEICFSHIEACRCDISRSRSNGASIMKEIPMKKIDCLLRALQGHSRSSEPTLIDWLHMTSY